MDLDSRDAFKTTNDDDADLKWVLEFERKLVDMEIESCKVAPTSAGSTNETKKAPVKTYAEVCAIADTTNETKKVPDKIYAEVCAILAALLSQGGTVPLAQDRLREQDRAPICYDHEKAEFSTSQVKF